MDVIQVASENGVILVDHHRRWEPLRVLTTSQNFQRMMIDPLHINAPGNMVMGVDDLCFRWQSADEQCPVCAGRHALQWSRTSETDPEGTGNQTTVRENEGFRCADRIASQGRRQRVTTGSGG